MKARGYLTYTEFCRQVDGEGVAPARLQEGSSCDKPRAPVMLATTHSAIDHPIAYETGQPASLTLCYLVYSLCSPFAIVVNWILLVPS